MKTRLFSVLALILIGLFAISGIANADDVPVSIEKVQIDGETVIEDGETVDGFAIDRGTDELDIKVWLRADEDQSLLKVSARIDTEYNSDMSEDKTEKFSMDAGDYRSKVLTISVPDRNDAGEYRLKIEVSNSIDEDVEETIVLRVKEARNAIKIKDVVFDPESQVKAGRGLYTKVRIQNIGETEEDVKVRVSIPELGVGASDYIDEVESDDSVTSEELWIRIPECAEAGQYTATVSVEYDDGEEEVSEDFLINVVDGDTCGIGAADKTIIAVSTETQTVAAGKTGAVYPLTISNTGSSAKTYTISAEAGEWADVKISPNVAVLAAGETKVVYVYVSASEDASEGEQTFSVAIKSGEETLKTISLKANVEASSGWDKAKKGLEVALVVLVVLLVVIGLIIGFNRLRGDEDEEGKDETYY